MGQAGSQAVKKWKEQKELEKEENKELEYDSGDEKGDEDPKWKGPNFDKEAQADKHIIRIRKKGRKPTDVVCFIIFVAFCFGMLVVAGIGFWKGRVERMYLPTDFMGRVCGRDNSGVLPYVLKLPGDADCIAGEAGNVTAANLCEKKVAPFKVDLTDRPNCWFMGLLDPIAYGCVCVSYCPGQFSGTNLFDGKDYNFCPLQLNTTYISDPLNIITTEYCTYTRPDNPNTFPATTEEQIISLSLKYSPVLRRCFPGVRYINATEILSQTKVYEVLNSGTEIVTNLFSFLFRSWRVLIICIVLAFIFSFTYIVLIRIFTAVLVWVTIFLTWIAIAALGAFLTWQGVSLRFQYLAKSLDPTVAHIIMGIGVGVCAIALVYGFAVIFLFLFIRKAIGIIQEASKAVALMPTIVALPITFGAAFLLFFAYWILVAVFLWSSGTSNIQRFAVRYTLDYYSQAIFSYHIFGLFWISAFLLYWEYAIIAGSIATWYFRRDKRMSIVGSPIIRAAARTTLCHLGSIAFGSLIVAIIQMMRYLFEKTQRELRKALGNNKISKYLVWLVRAILFVFEIIVRFLNKQAFIQMSIYGTSFLWSAKNAFALILRNGIQLGVLDFIAQVILWLGKLAIAFLTALAGYGFALIPYLVEESDGEVGYTSPILLCALVFVIAFIIASLFSNIMDVAVDTVLHCFLIDVEYCKADLNAKPFATTSLKRIVLEHQRLEAAKRCSCHCCICLTGFRNQEADDLATAKAAEKLPDFAELPDQVIRV